MPRYDYFCPANDRIVEVTHSISMTLHTWGEVCKVASVERGETPASAKVQRIIGPVMVLGTRRGGGGGGGHGGGNCCGESGCHG